MKTLRRAALAASLLVFAASSASAASITYNLDCTFQGPSNNRTCASPTGPFGTVTLTDSLVNANWVDIQVTLASGTLDRLYLNYVPGSPTPGSGYDFAGTNISDVDYDPNDVGPSGSYEFLDLDINPSGSPSTWTGVLMLRDPIGGGNYNYQNLDVAMFNVLSNDSNLKTPVWLAALFKVSTTICTKYDKNGVCKDWDTDTTDYKVGSLSYQAPPAATPPTSVPEPSTLLLMGLGLTIAARKLRARR